jgi:hypothetical protein
MSIPQEQEEVLTIRLPRKLNKRQIPAILEVAAKVQSSSGAIVLDGQDVEFIDPLGMAVLGATLQPLAGVRDVRLEWLPTDIGTYLSRMNVLRECAIEGVEVRPYQAADRRCSLVELMRLANEREVDDAVARLATAIEGVLLDGKLLAVAADKRAKYVYPLRYSLSELLLNALTHAKRSGRSAACVWVAAQFYQATGEVVVAVVDNGCGILSTLQGSAKLSDKTHEGAIKCALEPFVTCNPDLGLPFLDGTTNRGIGLTMTRRIAAAAGGSLSIISGNAVVDAGSGAPTSWALSEGVQWQGVAIVMTCMRSKLPSVNVESLFPEVDPDEGIALNFEE